MSRYVRSLGAGRLLKVKRGSGPAMWVLDYKGADGVRRRQSLSSDKNVALRLRNELIAQRDLQLAGLGAVEGQSRPLSEVVDAYIPDLATRSTLAHTRMAAATLKRVLTGLGVQRVRDVERHLVIAWRVKRLAAKDTPMMVNAHIKVLQAMLRWAADNGMIKENPIAGLKPLPIPKDLVRLKRRALSEDEIARLYAAAEEDDRAIEAYYRAEKTIAGGTKGETWNRLPRVQRVPQALLWRAFIETGARHGELLRATWEDLDVQGRTLTLRAETTKTAKERVIPLREELVRQIWGLRRTHLRVRRCRPIKSDPIFLSPEGLPWNLKSKTALRILKRVLERAGIPQKTERGEIVDVHSLRHTCASRMARSGVGLLQAQRILGHSDVRMTAQVYSHLGLDDLRAAIERVASVNAPPPTLTLVKDARTG